MTRPDPRCSRSLAPEALAAINEARFAYGDQPLTSDNQLAIPDDKWDKMSTDSQVDLWRRHGIGKPWPEYPEPSRCVSGYRNRPYGEVYFITDGNAIKIGHSFSALARMKTLQRATSHTLKLLVTISGSLDNEQYLHQQFKDIRLNGEWFRPTQVLLEFIKEVATRPGGKHWNDFRPLESQ